MKLSKLNRNRAVLPDERTVCSMIAHLPSPVNEMAWLMAETGCRISDLINMRVSDFNQRLRLVNVCTEQGCRHVDISAGLYEMLVDYLYRLRETYERYKREQVQWGRARIHLLHMFSDRLLFPAWSLIGFEKSNHDQSFPVNVFVHELQLAAASAGYTGVVHSNTLRLACALRWINEGLDIGTIHQRLGHRDIMTTMMMMQALRKEGLSFIPDRVDVVDLPVASVA